MSERAATGATSGRALVILPAYLGDTVFAGPAVRALADAGHEVALCVTPRGAPAARHLPGCAQVFVYDKRGRDRGLRGFVRVARTLRAWQPTLAIVPHRSLRSGALALGSGAPRRVGYAPLCNDRVAFDRTAPFVERALALARRAGAGGPGAERTLRLEAPPGLEVYSESVLRGARHPLVALVPGAEWATKRWGPAGWAEVARAVEDEGGSALLLGGPAERGLAAEVGARAGRPLRDATGNTIEEALALLARADAVVGGDTGLVHCARALGRPTVVLFGPTDPRRHVLGPRELALHLGLSCQPCHDHGPATCPLGHHRCLADLAPARVVDALRSALRTVDAPRPSRYGPRP